ncbi:MAG: phospholipase D family protein [Lachnospiraceae bacterium]
MRIKILKIVFVIVGLFLIYVVAGALLPFVKAKDVDQAFKDNFDTSSFYGDAVGVDRAAIVESSIDALNLRIQMIQEAKENIILSTFDIRVGESCDDIFSALLEAANRGVKVEILVDGLYGSLHMNDEPIFYAAGTHPNIEIKFYNIPSLLKPWTANGRMHDKYLIIDDKLLLAGGRNTFDYFLGDYNTKNLSYDREVLIFNTAAGTSDTSKSSIGQVEEYFQAMWSAKECELVFDTVKASLADRVEKARIKMESHISGMREMKPELFGEVDYTSFTVPTNKVTLISNPTHILAKEPWVWYQIKELMLEAKESAYIFTPYAVLNDDMYTDLKEVKKNVSNVTMQINSVAVGDNFMASSDYLFNKEKIIDLGLDIYEFQGNHSSHGKSFVVDDRISIIGSYNMDLRSTYLDTETMLVIDSESLNQKLKENILVMEEQSLKVASESTYIENPNVEEKELEEPRKYLYPFTKYLFQLIRFLI